MAAGAAYTRSPPAALPACRPRPAVTRRLRAQRRAAVVGAHVALDAPPTIRSRQREEHRAVIARDVLDGLLAERRRIAVARIVRLARQHAVRAHRGGRRRIRATDDDDRPDHERDADTELHGSTTP